MAQGYLQVDVVSDVNNFPVQDAEITISSVDAPETVIRRLMTNSSGQTENVVLEAPPKALTGTYEVRDDERAAKRSVADCLSGMGRCGHHHLAYRLDGLPSLCHPAQCTSVAGGILRFPDACVRPIGA